MTGAGSLRGNKTAIEQMTLLLINISTLGLYIVQLAVNIPLFQLGYFFPVPLGEAVTHRHCSAACQYVTGGFGPQYCPLPATLRWRLLDSFLRIVWVFPSF